MVCTATGTDHRDDSHAMGNSGATRYYSDLTRLAFHQKQRKNYFILSIFLDDLSCSEGPGFESRKGQEFSSSTESREGLWGPPSLQFISYGWNCTWRKPPKRVHTSNEKIKNNWSYIYTFPYAFIARISALRYINDKSKTF